MSNLFLRHGEVYNVKNIMYGDIPGYCLSSRGVSQAIEAGKFIHSNFQIEKIVSSPVLRARETSKYIAESLQVEIEISHNLYEWSGVIGWVGTTFDEFSKTQDYSTYLDNPIDIVNTSEPLEGVFDRVNLLYENSKHTLFVSHQDTIRAFTYYKTGSRVFNDDKPNHCGIQEIKDGTLVTHSY
jgi:broad specificity phosphatase PhoE